MDLEKSEIEKVVISFFEEMNAWEKYCDEVSKDNSLEYKEKEEKQRSSVKEIFLKRCTLKDRKMGKPAFFSYGHEGSYDYDPEEEKISEITIETKSKAFVLTSREQPMKEMFKYLIKKVNGVWLIDSKKGYSEWEDKWSNLLL